MLRSTLIKINDRGRDLTFRLTEMPATQHESWTLRTLLLLAASGVETPDNVGIEESAAFIMKNISKVLGSLDYERAKPLLDEMLACCARVDAGVEQVCTPETVDGYIEDMRTLLKLRIEAVKFNFTFLSQESLSVSQTKVPTVTLPRKS